MNAAFFKEIRNAFVEVESEDFLNQKIKIELEKIRADYKKLAPLYRSPEIYVKTKFGEINTTTTNTHEKMAIGIYGLALMEFEKEMKAAV